MIPVRSSARAILAAAAVAVAGCKFPFPADVLPEDAAVSGYAVGGTVSGLWMGAGVTLELEAGEVDEELVVGAGQPFAFTSRLADGTAYTVTLVDDGPDHDCQLAGAAGIIAGADVDDLRLTCVSLIPHGLTITTPIAFTFDPRITRYELPVSVLQQGVEVVVTGATLTGATVAGQPVTVGQLSPTVPLGQGTTTVPVVLTRGPLSQRYDLVFDRGAAPITEATYAQASNAGDSDTFGAAVGAWGEFAAVGASGEDSSTEQAFDNLAADSGAVYVFRRSGPAWSQTQILKGTAITEQRRLGNDVAMERGVLVVGASNDGANGGAAGAVYVFRLEEGTGVWRQQQRITAPDARAGDRFGEAVAIQGDRLLVGAPGHDRGGTATDYGQVYVFVFNGTVWTQEAIVRDQTSPMMAGFGTDVALAGETMVSRDYRGTIRVFRRSGVTWAAESVPPECRGAHFALDGDRLAVGQPNDASGNGQPGDQTAPDSGAVRVFERTAATWSEVAYLKAVSPERNARLGMATALRGDTLVATAASTSTLHAFQKVGASWIVLPPVRGSHTSGNEGAFGFEVALTTLGVVAGDGAHAGNGSPTSSRGSVWFFR